MEFGRAKKVLDRPGHPYTQLLLSSVPALDHRWRGSRDKLPDIESEEYRLVGCPFSGRCSKATELCMYERPGPTPFAVGRTVYCHYAETA
jgi:peptide/nickel transport system ATP-binding protein